jgi:hypothetical protein
MAFICGSIEEIPWLIASSTHFQLILGKLINF